MERRWTAQVDTMGACDAAGAWEWNDSGGEVDAGVFVCE